jgi:ATP/maltotriose-dependent transcriptional regulator MalT
MALDLEAQSRIRRAGLVHDLGKAAVPVGILDKDRNFSETDWVRFKLHPRYTEDVLSRIAPLRDLAVDAAAHHERPDGSGYHRQLTAEAIPLGGRILAVADAYVIEKRQTDDDPERSLARLLARPAGEQDRDALESLKTFVGMGSGGYARARTQSGLSEREVEVVRLAAQGKTNREIAKLLVISDKTVEHHLEHVFDKLGVTSRTAAVVFAVQNGLAP